MNPSLIRFGALSGALAMILIHVSMFLVIGESPNADATGKEIWVFWTDVGEDAGRLAGWIDMFGMISFLLFGAWVGSALRNGGSGISSMMVIGGIITVISAALITRGLAVNLAVHASDLPIESTQALHTISAGTYLPFMVGMVSMHLGFAFGAPSAGLVPSWFARLALIPAVILLIPHEIAWIGMPLTALWIIVTSVVLFVLTTTRENENMNS